MYPWTRPLVPTRYQTALLIAVLLMVFLPLFGMAWADSRDHHCWAWDGTEKEHYLPNAPGCD